MFPSKWIFRKNHLDPNIVCPYLILLLLLRSNVTLPAATCSITIPLHKFCWFCCASPSFWWKIDRPAKKKKLGQWRLNKSFLHFSVGCRGDIIPSKTLCPLFGTEKTGNPMDERHLKVAIQLPYKVRIWIKVVLSSFIKMRTYWQSKSILSLLMSERNQAQSVKKYKGKQKTTVNTNIIKATTRGKKKKQIFVSGPFCLSTSFTHPRTQC